MLRRSSRSCAWLWLVSPMAMLWLVCAPEGSPLSPAFSKPSSEDPVERAKRLLREADAVFFDVDSTVVTTEGIDLIGKCFGIMKEISELTHKAMNGHVKFQDAMAERLQLMADHGMTRDKLEECVKTEGAPKWSPGVQDVVKMLHKQGTDVYLVSGGFQNMIKPIALELHIPQKMIYANEILFDEQGKYAGFDRSAPTSASGGKPKVLKMMKRKKGYKTMIMFGDGATDLDARSNGPASAFIGYGGVQVREKVKNGADWFIHSFQEVLAGPPFPPADGSEVPEQDAVGGARSHRHEEPIPKSKDTIPPSQHHGAKAKGDKVSFGASLIDEASFSLLPQDAGTNK